MTLGQLAWIALAAMAVLFAVGFAVCRRVNNYGFVDGLWSYAFAALALFYGLLGAGWWTRRALLATLVMIWSVRLGTHLWRRLIRHHPQEDGRYVRLREDWGERLPLKMFGFFQLQAASVVILGIAFLIPTGNATTALHVWEWVGVILWGVAVAGEALADAQLDAFKRDPKNHGRVCTSGLWRYSRHPNYFFEWLAWVAYSAFALGSPGGWIALIAPAAMLFLLLRVTGIPATEEQSLRSKGDAYRRYQQVTNAFFPGPPRSKL